MNSVSYTFMQKRQDYLQAFLTVAEPAVKQLTSEQPGLLQLASSGTIYSEKTRMAEGFLRLLWGYGPYYAQKEVDETFHLLLKGIFQGVDPTSENYWGEVGEVDQLMVEMAPLSVFMVMNKEKVQQYSTEKQRKDLLNWISQINNHETAQNNWIFFRILVNVCLYKNYGIEMKEQFEKDFAKIETFYLGNGWYCDGVEEQIDYYISFAIHFYSLIYAVLFEKEDPKRSKLFKERASEFAETFQYWFDEEGRGIPFGRSLTYRFAQSSFWSAMLFAKVEDFDDGKAKNFLSKNLSFWFSQDIFSKEGLLKIGYCYENLVMSEEYNGPGSPYWALKSFLILALPEEDSVWQLPELEKTETKESLLVELKEARMLLSRSQDRKHVQAFPVGQFVELHTHGEAKYSKFVYSTVFGFNVSKGLVGYEKGGFDNVLAVSEQDKFYRVRTTFESYKTTNHYTVVTWKPWKDVTIESCIVPFGEWHFRFHKIQTDRDLTLRDGGFSIPYDGEDSVTCQSNVHSCFLTSRVGISGVISLLGKAKAAVSARLANVNVLYNNVIFPYLDWDVSAGTSIVCHAFLGEHRDVQQIVYPEMAIEGQMVQLKLADEVKEIMLPFGN